MFRLLYMGMGLLGSLWIGGSIGQAQQYCGWGTKAHTCQAHELGCAGLEGVPVDANSFISPPASYSPFAPRDASIIVNYNNFPEEAIIAFNYAVDIWSSVLTSDITIRIDAFWEELSGGSLAQAGPNNLHQNFTNAPFADTYYPAALANALVGEDLSEQSDISCSFNSAANWYFGTDGITAPSHYDFVTAALHEIGHGLGFIGSAYYTNGFGFIGTANVPYAYDHFTETADSISLMDLSNGSQTLGSALTSNQIYWNGPGGVDGVGGSRPRLHAPSAYSPGSSYSHLNESTYTAGNPNSLMTPSLNTAESIHDPGPAMLGMFEDMGWTVGGCQWMEVELGAQSNCNPENDAFNQTLILHFEAAPSTGLISVNGDLFTLTESPKTVILNGLISDGQSVDLDIFFTANPECGIFIPDAFVAPASCYCLTDLSGNLLTEVQDILLILADFGCLESCVADVTNDDATNVADVLAVLAAFGIPCP